MSIGQSRCGFKMLLREIELKLESVQHLCEISRGKSIFLIRLTGIRLAMSSKSCKDIVTKDGGVYYLLVAWHDSTFDVTLTNLKFAWERCGEP